MTKLIEFKLEDDTYIVVEVEDLETGGTVRASRAGEMVEEAKETFEQALSKIRQPTEKVVKILRGLTQRPDEIEMEFGFSLNTAVGVIIASASTAANYKVTLRWKNEEHYDEKESAH